MSFWERGNRYRGNIHIGKPTNTRLLTRHTTSSAKSAVRTLTQSDDATKHSVTDEGHPQEKSRLTTCTLARPHLVGERTDDLIANVVEHLWGVPHEAFLDEREVVRVLCDVGAQGVWDLY